MTVLNISDLQVHDLQPVSFSVDKELVCLSGPSGSGKSLLLRAIADLIVHQGETCLDDKKCSAVNPVSWRQWVGLLPAESAWWHDRVGDHFKYQKHDYLNALNLPDESLDWEVSRCSTGEKQRLAIARLLQLKPKALLLDEPTASLDAASVKKVEAVIQQYASEFNVPVIWVSHDEEQIKRLAHRVLRIENKKIMELDA
jgi:ABC-type iron transport system FetAB ATPase subunit